MRLLLFATCLSTGLLPGQGWANWERVTTRTVQEMTLNTSQSAVFRRETFQAVSGLAIDANASLIQQGQWNGGVQFSPTTAGATFSLLRYSQNADPPPVNGFGALGGPSTERRTSSAPNQLEGWMTPSGELRAAPGVRSSEVNLTATQSLSVF